MREKWRSLSSDTQRIIVLIVIGVVTHWPWFLLYKNFTSGDWWYIGIERYRDFLQFSPLWVTDNLGGTSAVPHFYLLRWFEGLFTLVGGSFALSEKVFYLIPMALLASLGSYMFLRHYFKPNLAFVGALIYSFNTAYLFNHAGPLTIGMAYALAPWALYAFKLLLRRPRDWRLVAVNALILGVIALYELRITLLIIGVLAGLFLFNVVVRADRKVYFRRGVVPLLAVGVLLLLLHAFWVIPYGISAGAMTFSDLASRGLFVSFSDILNALTLHHPFWTGGRPSTFIPQSIPFYAWLIPVFAFAGFAFRVRRSVHMEMGYWALIAIAGIFLVKQVNEPLTYAYPWLFSHIPGFGAFRESSKFYLFVALAYSVLIPFTLRQIYHFVDEHVSKKALPVKYLKVGMIGLVTVATGLFAINALPLVTGEFRTMMTPRNMPQEYKTLNTFVHNQKDYFRTLWVPVDSRWAVPTNQHPKLLPGALTTGQWLTQANVPKEEGYATMRDKIVQLFAHQTANDLLDAASVKYVVVPLRDTANEDDFFRYYGDDRQYYIDHLDTMPYLKRVDAGTKEIVVYENTQYKPHLSAFTSLASVNLPRPMEDMHRFITNQLGQDFQFVQYDPRDAKQKAPEYPATRITDLSAELTHQAKLTAAEITFKMSGGELFANQNAREISYEFLSGQLHVAAKPTKKLLANGQAVVNSAEGAPRVASLSPQGEVYLQSEQKVSQLRRAQQTGHLGLLDKPLAFYQESGQNALANASFEDGPWQATVQDCNNYDNSGEVSMSVQKDERKNGQKILQLEAGKHTACTESSAVGVTAGNYLLAFDYRVGGGFATGYEVEFNDPAGTKTKKELTVESQDWQSHQTILAVPTGATQLKIRLFGYPDYRLQNYAIVNFDDFRLMPLRQLIALDKELQPNFVATAPANQTELTYPVSAGNSRNLLQNGSFEDGLWQKKVGDCNAYDGSPALGMKLAKRDESDGAGKQALQLEARRHRACTTQERIKVEENHNYLLSFDFQSPNAQKAGFYVRFNDGSRTEIEEFIPVKGNGWQKYARQIKAPFGATEMILTFYAFGDEYGRSMLINRYDNAAFIAVPDLQHQYYEVTKPAVELRQPQSITFETVHATKKNVRIKGAQGPFYIAMSEAYHPLWRLELRNSKSTGLLNGWWPLAKPDAVASKHHFRLNDFQNGWYVDPAALCQQGKCSANADGSYDLEMMVEFTPQRWLVLGTLISGVTVAGLTAGLGYSRWRKRQ